MPAAPNDLTTIAAVKAMLGITVATSDTDLQTWVTGASTWIESVLSRTLRSLPRTEVKDGTGGDRCWLRHAPCTAVTSVLVNGLPIPAATPGGTDDGWLRSDDDPQVISLRGYSFARGRANVQVAYTAGFATTPPDLERACASIVAWRWRERDRIGHASKTVGTETVAFQTSATAADVKLILDQYRRVVPA